MKRVSKRFYILAPIVAVVLAVIAVIASGSRIQRGEVPPIAFVILIPYLGVMMSLVYKAWAAIQDGYARTSPGKAVGFLFIPLFNIYWLFQVTWGFAKDYNRFRERHSINGPKLPESVFFGFAILVLVTPWIPAPTPLPLILLFWFFSVIASTCNAINAIPVGLSFQAQGVSQIRIDTPTQSSLPHASGGPPAT